MWNKQVNHQSANEDHVDSTLCAYSTFSSVESKGCSLQSSLTNSAECTFKCQGLIILIGRCRSWIGGCDWSLHVVSADEAHEQNVAAEHQRLGARHAGRLQPGTQHTVLIWTWSGLG